ncbi:hypothetical protein [Nitratireductor luteus]|uniref:hypothetical protein n=1 Tax=Nitratireductor luteus TaxID=2976980 RepID=UPI00223FDDC0|nr:hypothetical protein [Nitratireductor luteus]
MLAPRPDFSPTMLRFFLRARAKQAVADSGRPGQSYRIVKDFKTRLRKSAGVTVTQMDLAWMGRLNTPEPRARLWAVLGHFPADHGVTLTHGGQDDG